MNTRHLEEWRDVVGYEGLYRVSNLGRIYSIRTDTIKKPQIGGKNDRYQINLHKDGKRKTYQIAPLVLSSFVSERPKGLIGCHNDGNGFNNHVSNLRWDTYESNSLDTVRHGSHDNGNTNKDSCNRGHALSGKNLGKSLKKRRCKACGKAQAYAKYHSVPLTDELYSWAYEYVMNK